MIMLQCDYHGLGSRRSFVGSLRVDLSLDPVSKKAQEDTPKADVCDPAGILKDFFH